MVLPVKTFTAPALEGRLIQAAGRQMDRKSGVEDRKGEEIKNSLEA